MDAEGLKSVPLFSSLSDDARREFAVWVDELKVSSGKHLVDEGDYAYDLFVIEDGEAEVTRDSDHVADNQLLAPRPPDVRRLVYLEPNPMSEVVVEALAEGLAQSLGP